MRILVVEDDAKIANAVQRGLEAEGFSVDVAFDGEDGLWKATEGSFDLIVLDVMLPRRNGFVVCRELRAAGNWVPILMLTAKDGELDEAEGLDTGADDYLTKPFSFTVLLARVRSLLRRVERREVAATTLGGMTIDPIARRVTVAGEPVELTRREFDVLEHLVRRPGHVVTKAEIINGVWGFEFEGDPNVVEVYVGRLRRKLVDPSGVADIETVRGVGYRIGGRDGD